ncbi:MAG TPA: DinB family protein [Ktedonobacterales bacterium]
MASQHPMLAGIYQGWERYNGLLAGALAPLSDEQLDLRATPNLRSIRELATHLIAVRARWFHLALSEGGDELAAIGAWDRPGEPARSASELLAGLEATWRQMTEAIARWTPEQLDETITEEEDGETETFTRPEVIWHLIEHDLHHGGEIGYSLGMHGLAAPDI